MARRPSLVKPFMQLNKAILYEESVLDATKMLMSLTVSLSTGCLYRQPHMANLSSIFNMSDEKIAALMNFEDSELFSEAEKAAINLAFRSASQPNQTNSQTLTGF